MILLLSFFLACGPGVQRQEKQPAPKPSPPPKILTLDKYNQLKDGMSYEEVVKVLGVEGKLTADQSDRTGSTKNYDWTERPGEAISLIFQNNKLKSKLQIGLQ